MNSLVQRFSPASCSKSSYSEDEEATQAFGRPRKPLDFPLPPVADTAAFLGHYTDVNSSNDSARIKIAHGTTTLAFRFQGGVVVAVDSRATAGSYIASGTVKKVIEINRYLREPFVFGINEADFAQLGLWLVVQLTVNIGKRTLFVNLDCFLRPDRYLGIQCRLHELREKERISVAAASKYLANLVYSYKGMGLSMGTMICGWDKTGPAIFYVDNDGTRLKGDLFSVGSGSTFAYGVLDQGYRYDLTEEEALDLGRRSIYAAAHRDAFSGNSCNLFLITQDGQRQIANYPFNELHYDMGYAAEYLKKEVTLVQ